MGTLAKTASGLDDEVWITVTTSPTKAQMALNTSLITMALDASLAPK
jgi:hypothetical protein